MQKKVKEYIREHKMLVEGDRVIAAVSGGADSVCMLHILWTLQEELSVTLSAVHIHHGIRGAEADRDAEYTEMLCRGLHIPCLVVHRDVPGYAKDHGLSMEEAGRILRYEILREEAERLGGAKLAVAHHSGDQAETILHHLFRGSSLRGLGGMTPVAGDIIRPLLGCGREEILQYLKECKTAYCEDSTNASGEYTRNKLRNTILPMIVSEINHGAVKHILHAGDMAAQADAYLEKTAVVIWREYGVEEPGRAGISADVLKEQEPIIRTYLILNMISRVCGSRKDITAGHVEQIAELFSKEVGARIDLPYGLIGWKSYTELWIEHRKAAGFVEKSAVRELPEPVYTCFSYEKLRKFPENEYTKWFDYDKIKGTLSVRTRQTGDYITLKDEKRKTVKSYMIDEKIPKEQRDAIPLLAEGSHVLWIVGYRISEYYKITDKTKQILQVKMDGGKSDGR